MQTTPAEPPRFLSLAGAVRYSTLSRRSLGRLITEGRLRAYRPTPRRLLIAADELEAVIKAAACAARDTPAGVSEVT